MSVVINGSAGVTTNSGAVYNGIQAGTAVASTSGTSVDFTSIPSWVKRITVMFSAVSTNGSSNWQVQIGSGSFTSSGYVGTSSLLDTVVSSTAFTAGFGIRANSATIAVNGSLILTLITGNTWVASGAFSGSTSATSTLVSGGTLALGGTLDRIRITTVNGTDTFDAGSINILYE
jgi:expansin (peptidoglycan-binding protein)